MSELSPELRDQIEKTIRFLAVDAVQEANSGHPGAPMALAGPAFELFDNHLRFDPSDPRWPLRDRFVLSNGHASMLLYALLHLWGYDVSHDDIKAFRKLGSKTPGHPEFGDTPGVEVTTGPLGQGFGHGVGMALAGKLTASQFGADGHGPGQHFVYGIVSDGDLMEGVAAESASLAGHLGLGNLIYLYDDNKITIDGGTELSFSENVAQRFESYGWHVLVADGEDVPAIRAALEAGRAETGRPTLIVMRTTIGLGAPNRAGTSKAHGSPLGDEERKLTKQAAGWPLEPTFLVPDEVRAHLAGRIEAKKKARQEADAALAAWRSAHPERAAAWDAALDRKMPADLAQQLSEGLVDAVDATRNHSGAVLQRLAKLVPYMVGGSADLAGSAAPSLMKEVGAVGPGAGEGSDPFAGRNIYFGIREHAMGAITNGINLDGTFIGYSGTFLIFSDYMRPAIRLSALMKTRSIFVFTHDSVFLGEDGPTHQPVEHLDALRAIPGLNVFRPADAVETALSYAWILEHAEGPSLLSLSRQKVQPSPYAALLAADEFAKGAYTVKPSKGAPDVVLMASGSELPLACEAADALATSGVAARVVSAPCLELFAKQDASYRDELLPPGTPVVAVEAACGESFRRFVGDRGLVYGIDRFGTSAPLGDIAEFFGFTPEKLSARVREHLGR